MLLSTRRNRYYNDDGLEIIILLRTIVLFFFIFNTTFNSLLNFPSRDILNKAFFSSNSLFFYRFSTNSGICWIFLEAAFSTYKLMKFIEKKMKEYNQGNNFKGYFTNLIIIYGQFLFLFIPKICIFIFCYLIFYTDIKKFICIFSYKAFFRHIVEYRITNNIKCNKETSLIFSSLFTFTKNADNFNKCYDFTFIYFNIFYCFLFSMISTFIILLVKKSIFEIYLIVSYLFFFMGLIIIVEDDKYKAKKEKSNLYSYYHFKGQEYTTKIAYLTLVFYTLGLIFGILCYNYDNLKKNWNPRKNKQKNKKSVINNMLRDTNSMEEFNNDINNKKSENIYNMRNALLSAPSIKRKNSKNKMQYERIKYFPLSFLTNTLKSINGLKPRSKIIIIIICLIVQLFLSFFFKLYSEITKDSRRGKYNDVFNYNKNYVLLIINGV